MDADPGATCPVGKEEMTAADSVPCEFYLNWEAGELR
jgi:hypothetical protein